MEEILSLNLNDLILKYPAINMVLDKYNLKCSGCLLADNYSLKDFLKDNKEINDELLKIIDVIK